MIPAICSVRLRLSMRRCLDPPHPRKSALDLRPYRQTTTTPSTQFCHLTTPTPPPTTPRHTQTSPQQGIFLGTMQPIKPLGPRLLSQTSPCSILPLCKDFTYKKTIQASNAIPHIRDAELCCKVPEWPFFHVSPTHFEALQGYKMQFKIINSSDTFPVLCKP